MFNWWVTAGSGIPPSPRLRRAEAVSGSPLPKAGPRYRLSGVPQSGDCKRRVVDKMYYTYVIHSKESGKYYVGYTSDLETRLDYHNSGANRSTRPGRPWRLVHAESFQTKREAWLRERQIKSYKGGEAFKKLVDKKQ